MASAATVEMMGGTPEMALNAAAIVFKNILGLVCDPIAGLVEVPCAKRNFAGAVSALTTADLVMAGITSKIPFDDTVEAMYRVGRDMPASLRETAMGGLAITKTGLELNKKVFGEKILIKPTLLKKISILHISRLFFTLFYCTYYCVSKSLSFKFYNSFYCCTTWRTNIIF